MSKVSIRQQIKDLTDQINTGGVENDELFNKVVELEKIQYTELVPLCDRGERENKTYFSLAVHEELDIIKKRCIKWYEDYFFGTIMPKSPIHTRNLILDLDYMFTTGLWLLNLANKLGFADDHMNEYFAKMYIRYEEGGYKAVVAYHVDKYNKDKDRPYTEKEYKKLCDKRNSFAKKYFEKFAITK
jgi:hypothetical protein